MTHSIGPEFELIQDFMPVLVTSKFDEDPIKNERASLETPFSHYKSALVTSKFDEDQIKTEGIGVEASFSPL